MFTALHRLLGGSSPITGYIGSAIMILDVLQQALIQGGIPQDAAGWLTFGSLFLTGLGVRLSKDANKSNAPKPLAAPSTVPVVLLVVMAFGLTGCGHTVEQLQKVAHDAIDTAGKIYQDVTENIEAAKKTLRADPAPVPPVQTSAPAGQ